MLFIISLFSFASVPSTLCMGLLKSRLCACNERMCVQCIQTQCVYQDNFTGLLLLLILYMHEACSPYSIGVKAIDFQIRLLPSMW